MGNSSSGMAMTVEGPVDPGGLGITLTHEHFLLDIQCYALPPRTDRQRAHLGKPLAMEMLGEIRRDVTSFPEALLLDNQDTAARELGEFVKSGGKTVVDCTPKGIGRNVAGVRDIGRHVGLNMIVGCGYYIGASHPPEVRGASVDSLRESLLSEINAGIDGTGIRPGVIGEIGTSQPVQAEEWKVLEAACQAQKATGLPLYIHPYFGTRSRVAPEIVRFVLRQGVNPQKVNMCHMDGYMNLAYQLRVLNMGVNISFDTFGLEVYYDSLEFNHNCHDSEREKHLLQLLDRGCVDQILISQDVCMKVQLEEYGGYGYNHLMGHIIPSLKHEGVGPETLDRLLIDNPRRLLTID